MEGSAELGAMLFVDVATAPTSLAIPITSSPSSSSFSLSSTPSSEPGSPAPVEGETKRLSASMGAGEDGGVSRRRRLLYTGLVAAVSANGECAFVWRMLLEPESFPTIGANRPQKESRLTSTLLAKHTFAPEARVTCATLAGTAVRDTPAPFHPLLLTGGADGVVRLWCVAPLSSKAVVNENEPKYKLREMTSFQAYPSDPVASIRSSYFGRIATSAANKSEVRIWEFESATPAYKLEYTLQCAPATGEEGQKSTAPAPEPHFDWLPLASGKYVLAVGCGTEVRIYGQRRTQMLQSFQVEWVVTDSFTALSHPVRSVAWGKDAVLTVGSANILFVFSKWRDVIQVCNKIVLSALPLSLSPLSPLYFSLLSLCLSPLPH
jgi:hypothetical protein